MEKLDSLNNLSDKKIKELLQHGINLATEVCMSYDNYISIEFANNYKNKTNH